MPKDRGRQPRDVLLTLHLVDQLLELGDVCMPGKSIAVFVRRAARDAPMHRPGQGMSTYIPCDLCSACSNGCMHFAFVRARGRGAHLVRRRQRRQRRNQGRGALVEQWADARCVVPLLGAAGAGAHRAQASLAGPEEPARFVAGQLLDALASDSAQ